MPPPVHTCQHPSQAWLDTQSILQNTPVYDYLVPGFMKEAGAWYAAEFHDHLANPPLAPVWFKSVLWGELVLQLPFFFVAVYAWCTKSDWIRLPAIAYGAHTATTLVPILGDFLFNTGPEVLFTQPSQRYLLAGIYFPYLLMPVLIAWRAASRAHLFDPDVTAGPLVPRKVKAE